MYFCFFISTETMDVLQLDAVENITWSRKGEIAQYTTISGKQKSDHYHPHLRVVTIEGMIAQTKAWDNPMTPEAYMKETNAIIDRQKTFNFLMGGNYPQLEDIGAVVITNIEASRNVDIENGLNVSITFEEIDINDLVSKTVINPAPKPSKATNGSAAGKGKGGTGSKEEIDPESGLKFTQMAKASGYK